MNKYVIVINKCNYRDEANKELMLGIPGLGAIFVQMNEVIYIYDLKQ